MDNVHFLGDVYKDVLVSRISILQSRLARHSEHLGNGCLQPHHRFGQVIKSKLSLVMLNKDFWSFSSLFSWIISQKFTAVQQFSKKYVLNLLIESLAKHSEGLSERLILDPAILIKFFKTWIQNQIGLE